MFKDNQLFNTGTDWFALVTPWAIKIAVAIAVYIIGMWIARRIVNLIAKIMEKRNIDPVLRNFIRSILSTVFLFCVALAAIQNLGVDITSLLALLGAAGLAIGLALKDSLSNFAAGVMLIIFKPFKIGNFVEAGGTKGIVEEISVFNTVLISPDNKEIIVPNSQIYGSTIVNYSAKPTRRIDLVIGIGYNDDMKKAHDLMLEVLKNNEAVLQNPAPVIAVDELGDSSVNFVVRPWVKTSDYWPARWALIESIKNSFDANGISIPYPQQDVYMHAVEQ